MPAAHATHVVAGSGAELTSVSAAAKVSLLREHGAVLFRGFAVDTDGFRAVANEIGRGFYNMALDPRIREMVSADGVVAGVLKGTTALPLHMERGYSPLKPELVMFHVVQPAPVGGESLLCHGARVLEEMPAALVEMFRTKRLMYRHTWEPAAWQSRYGETPDEVLARFAQYPEVIDVRFDGDLLHYTYVTSAIVRSRLSGIEGFCNNLEGAWEVQNAPSETRRAVHDHAVLFEDGEPITATLIDDVHEAVVRATETHDQEAGDLIVADNFRVMHARKAFEGPRVMHTIMADLRYGE